MARVRRLSMVGALIAAVWARNSSWLHGPTGRPPELLAHRALGQTFPSHGLDGLEATARRIHPPEHDYLENTLPAMEAAFRYGADIVELDVQRTADDRFAVFRDDRLEYRTNAEGRVRDFTLEQLKRLDVGHGYSADGGATFPFRGKGVGLLPSLDEVLERFSDRELLVEIESDDRGDGEVMADLLLALPGERRRLLAVYGGQEPIDALAEALPELRVMSRSRLMEASLAYLLLGWSGYVPAACRGTELHLGSSYAPLFWGWPHRFVERMRSVGTRVVLVDGGGRWSEGFDSEESLRALPPGFAGVILTNRIDRVGPVIPSP